MPSHNVTTLYPYQGEALPLYRIAQKVGKHSGTLYKRIERGMTLEQAIAAPDGRLRRNKLTKER